MNYYQVDIYTDDDCIIFHDDDEYWATIEITEYYVKIDHSYDDTMYIPTHRIKSIEMHEEVEEGIEVTDKLGKGRSNRTLIKECESYGI